MLNTEIVKYLQSRPYRIRISIFIFTVGVTGVILFSIWLGSLKNTFMAETNKSDTGKQAAAIGAEENSAPSLMDNMKANISEIGGTAFDFFGNYFKEKSKSSEGGAKEKIRIIKPVKLPTDRQ